MIISSLINGKVQKSNASSVKFDIDTQVLVVGAGSAGVFACDSACREGVNVTLIEFTSTLGGMHVKGNVTGFYMGSSGGSFESDLIKNEEDTVFYNGESCWEQKQIRVTERLSKSGANILTNTIVTGIYFEKNQAVGVQAFQDGKFINIKTQKIIFKF